MSLIYRPVYICPSFATLQNYGPKIKKIPVPALTHVTILLSYFFMFIFRRPTVWSINYFRYNIAANNLEVDAIFVYTKNGHMASLLSRCRPDCPIFAFTTTTSLRRRLNLQWGLIPFRLSFTDDMESNLNKTFSLLKARGMIKSGDLVIAVSDMLQSIQVMNVP